MNIAAHRSQAWRGRVCWEMETEEHGGRRKRNLVCRHGEGTTGLKSQEGAEAG